MPDNNDNIIHFQYSGQYILCMPALRENFTLIESWLEEICGQLGFSPKESVHLQIAADEIFTNICMYAYPEGSENRSLSLSCTYNKADNMLVLTFVDSGLPFNPLEQTEEPQEQNSAKKKGGLGIYMIRQFADKLSYERKEGSNVLTFGKIVR